MEVLRTVPEMVWGLILITVAGVGPVAGAVALGIHSTGCPARLFAETLENVPPAPPDGHGVRCIAVVHRAVCGARAVPAGVEFADGHRHGINWRRRHWPGAL
jgi:ABC-type phosphate/phosphonate transport system permease subunit